MIKKTLSLLNDKPNIFEFPQSTIDAFLIDESDKELFMSSVKIFFSKAKSHFTSKYIKFHIDSNLDFFDIARIKKYPLPAVYNKLTKRGIINISAFGRRAISNINMRDLYAMMVYANTCSYLSGGVTISDKHADPFAEYMAFVFLKTFSKQYGITGSYLDLIPMFRFLIYVYVYQSFFGIDKKQSVKRASHLAKFDPVKLKIELSKYNFMQIDDLLLALNDSQVTPGLGKYSFLEKMLRSFGTINLPFFEDIMRFSSTMLASTVNGNSYFPPTLQMYNSNLYNKVNSIIESTINKAM